MAQAFPLRAGTFRILTEISLQPADHVRRKRVSHASVVEAALASYLSTDALDRLEATLARRLDGPTRHGGRLERQVAISNEPLAPFVRFWLTATPPPDTPRPPHRR